MSMEQNHKANLKEIYDGFQSMFVKSSCFYMEKQMLIYIFSIAI